ncbi:phosphoribosylformylglycinamidine synthase subunit PurS [Swingsia samuiensis]|uniref:Phosphoribosylformylglycinamidine synthase subunit PurS n=1 Tax=Swingsia samuiensis TaxID=1293412 RepID=A0A4Y6UN84_9PROT|nr:phosphoribosylformylglycinamidine synthase subunit PurS [Swingsia samuiensis]QDH17841.1 phosphoribosylformylglycinamidine synthase subunit PurS [Swingsia samuiensis]
MKVRVYVSLKDGVLDPQGKAVEHALESLGFKDVGEVRVNRVVELELPTNDADQARAQGEAMARALLANEVIENFSVEVE